MIYPEHALVIKQANPRTSSTLRFPSLISAYYFVNLPVIAWYTEQIIWSSGFLFIGSSGFGLMYLSLLIGLQQNLCLSKKFQIIFQFPKILSFSSFSFFGRKWGMSAELYYHHILHFGRMPSEFTISLACCYWESCYSEVKQIILFITKSSTCTTCKAAKREWKTFNFFKVANIFSKC